MELRVLELYSGIGGYHFALKDLGSPLKAVFPIDVNDLANSVYEHNFGVAPRPMDLNKLSCSEIEEMNPNLLVMSPPCQPFTRTGNQMHLKDARASSFVHVLEVLSDCLSRPQSTDFLAWIMLENVVGFESSDARSIMVDMLLSFDYKIAECAVVPSQIGVPNSRPRYYLLARRKSPLNDEADKSVFERSFSKYVDNEGKVGDYLDENENETEYRYLDEEGIRRHFRVMDIVSPLSRDSCCFTKAYGRYMKGAGSLLLVDSADEAKCKADIDMETLFPSSNSFNGSKLRYFTPNEVARLMCFPREFQFPENLTTRQKYQLLGNSVNVGVVKHLLDHLTRLP